MADDGTRKLGPGELTVGATGTEVDVSCLINNATLAATKDEGDSTTKLCGTVKPGAVSYTYALSGNVDIDAALESGFFAMTQENPGTELAFTYTPNSEFTAPATAATTATGTLVIDPLDFGGDTMGETMTSDFEFSVVGAPAYSYEIAGALALSADEESEAVAS